MLIKRKSIEAQANHKAGPGRDKTPPPAKPPRKPKFAPVTLSEEGGVRYLHFGTEWVQGAMRIRKPDWLELEYAQQMMAWMLFIDSRAHIVQLGLGTGALTKFCYRQFPQARVTAVELNPSVIAICESMFKLPPEDERLTVLEMDAMDFVTDPAQPRRHRRAAGRPVRRHRARPGAGHAGVLRRLRRLPGAGRHDDGQPVRRPSELCEKPEGDALRVRRRDLPARSPRRQRGRARASRRGRRSTSPRCTSAPTQIVPATKLPAKSWVNGLKSWQLQR